MAPGAASSIHSMGRSGGRPTSGSTPLGGGPRGIGGQPPQFNLLGRSGRHPTSGLTPLGGGPRGIGGQPPPSGRWDGVAAVPPRA